MRADNRALAKQEKNLKKRRARLMQACLARSTSSLCSLGETHLLQAAHQLSDDDLLVLLRQPPGDPALESRARGGRVSRAESRQSAAGSPSATPCS